MKVLLYLLVPVLIVAVFATISWARTRQPTSLDSGIDAFQREMRALSPDAAPLHRRREPGTSGPAPDAPPAGTTATPTDRRRPAAGRSRPARGGQPRPPGPPRRPPTPDRGR